MKILRSNIVRVVRFSAIFSRCIRLASVGAFFLASAEISAGPLQMFIDDHGIATSEGITRVLEQPVKADTPILVANDTWDKNPYLFGSVIYDQEDRIFKMWYQSYNKGLPRPQRTPILYATSVDGRKWVRPELGIIEMLGSRANNVVLLSLGVTDLYNPSVIKDAGESNPDRRYKLVYWDSYEKDPYKGGGMFVAFSPDGLHWKRLKDEPVLRSQKHDKSVSDVVDVMQDPATGKYVVYAKGWAMPHPKFRQIVRSESKDFVNWTNPEVVLTHQFNEADPQSYGMPVFAYEGIYLGLLRSYKKPGNDKMDVQLTVSRDGKKWSRVANEATFIPTGPEGAWDDGMILTAPPIAHGYEILIYYGGWDGPHEAKRKSAISLATLPVGRFVGIQAEQGEGRLITKPFKLEGNRITLNAKSGSGAICVSILDENGKPLAGFERESADAVRADELARPLAWKGSTDLSALAGKIVQLQFDITGDAKLYGYRQQSK